MRRPALLISRLLTLFNFTDEQLLWKHKVKCVCYSSRVRKEKRSMHQRPLPEANSEALLQHHRISLGNKWSARMCLIRVLCRTYLKIDLGVF